VGLSDIFDIAKNSGRWKKYSRGVMIRCPVHADKNPSCAVWTDGKVIHVKCFAGCDSLDVADSLRTRGFVLSEREQRGYDRRDLSRTMKAARPVHDHDCAVRTMLARDIWDECRSAAGSPVEAYLANRGLSLAIVPRPDHTVRYHPHCPRGKSRQPAMVCSMRDVSSDRVIAVHRTYLKDWRKDGQPMVLGPCHETAIKLSPHSLLFANGRTFVPLLHVCEGLETAIGCLMLDYAPVWALGNAGAIRAFAPQLQIGELVVLADHDREILDGQGHLWRPGVSAAQVCVKAWRLAGWRASYELPECEGDDFADVAEREMQRLKVWAGK